MKNSAMIALTWALTALGMVSPTLATVLPVTPGGWTLAILPDTQYYAASYPSIFYSQTSFLAANKNTLNLAYVLHEGDVTGSNTTSQWSVASTAFQTLDNAGINYSIAPGNHDYTSDSTDRSSLMANYFPVSRLDNQPTFGGVYPDEPNSPLNSYSLFSAGGKDWLVFALEFGPRDEILNWADGLMKANPDRQAIIVTHANLYCDGTLYDWNTKGTGQRWNPHAYGFGSMTPPPNDGMEMWQHLKDNPNLKFVFNGHVLYDLTAYATTVGDQGNVVHHVLANYQSITNGGNGYMRLLEFMPDGETVNIRTYSSTLESYLTNPNQQFTISLSSPPPLMRHAVGANMVVSGPAKPGEAAFTLTVPQSGTPQVGTTWQYNQGDYQLTVGPEDVTYSKGILMATVAQNLRDGYRATVEVGRNSFSDGQLALSVTQAGQATSTEVNFNVSTAWFEFDAGWQGAHVNADGTLAAAQGVVSSMVSRSNTGRYAVDLDVDSRSDGMLFAVGNNNSNKIVDTGVRSDGSGWDIRVQNNAANFAATGIDADWSLLYLPYDTENLIGGRYDGINGANLNSAGTFTMTRQSAGVYRLTIPGESPETGMLILSIAYEATSGGVTAPDDNIMCYENDGLGNFLIRSYDLTGSSTLSAQNTQFVWAYIDFSDPICVPVPEPSTWLLLSSAALLFAVRRGKKRLVA